MKVFFSIIICRIISNLSKIINKEGSVIGGAFVNFLFPNVLKKIKYPKYVIGITGSSGKGSTTELVARILKENNFKVVYNKNGSNVQNAVTSLVLLNTKLNGKLDADALVMELDERHSSISLKDIQLTHLVITNITRDQPPRNAHPEFIQETIRKLINKDTTLLINIDDPLVNALTIDFKGKVKTYGMENNKYSIPTKLNNLDAAYCPICNKKLLYSYYHYGHIGSYKCPNGDFKRTKPDYIAKNIDVDNYKIEINKKEIKLPSNFLYSVYFVLASYAICNMIGIEEKNIIKVINDPTFKPKRYNIYDFNNRKWQMLASKNENNLSYKQSLDYIIHEKGKKTVVLGFDNSSRRYRENDISWIWDIDFEELTHKSIDKIVLIGRFKYDMLVRMKYAGISDNKIILIDNLSNDLIPTLKKKTKGNIYSCVCFDKEIELKALLKEENNANN